MDERPINVVCGIIVYQGRVLATRRDHGRAFPLLWEFPGGKIEHGETAEAALHRELEEELSLKVEILKPLEPVDYRANGHNLSLIPFLCKPAQSQAPVPHEHTEMRWIRPDEVGQIDWAPADIPIVRLLADLV
jgi:8-oxo-dGTP diphosphatase